MKDKKGINKGSYYEDIRKQEFVKKWNNEWKELEKVFLPQKAQNNPHLSRLADFKEILFEDLEKLNQVTGVFEKIMKTMSEYIVRTAEVEGEDLSYFKDFIDSLILRRRKLTKLDTIKSFINLVIQESKDAELNKVSIENTYVLDENGEIIRKKKRNKTSLQKEAIKKYIYSHPSVWKNHLDGKIKNQEMIEKISKSELDPDDPQITLRTYKKWKSQFNPNK